MASFTRVTKALLFASLVFARMSSAQDESSPAPTSAPTTVSSEEVSTSTRSPVTYTVDVGDAGNHKFKPDLITALPGDTVEFLFGPTNHSVVRAEYEYPCIPYEMTGRGKVGFFSGFYAVDTYDSQATWSIKINDTDPIFFYCSAPESCLTWAMIGVINPNGSVSLERQKQLAREADYMLNPGEPFPAEASSTMASLTQDPTSQPTGGAAGNGNDNADRGNGGLGAGAIAGIAVGVAAIVALAGGLFFYMGRSKGYKFALKRSDATVPRTTPGNDYMAPPGHPDMYQTGGMYAPSDAHRSMGTMSPPPPFSSPMMYPKEQHTMVGEMESPSLHNRDTYQSSMFTEHIAPSDRYSMISERKSTQPGVHEMYVPPNSPPLPSSPPPDPSKSSLGQ